MFLLELAKRPGVMESMLAGRPPDIPSSLRQLVASRVSSLPASARDLLLVAALADGPSLPVVLGSAPDPSGVLDDLRDVMAANLLASAGERVLVTHPLVRSVIVSTADPADRQAAHARLATAAERPEERARHLALSAEGPDELIAADLEAAAIAAAGRGACAVAADLGELAASLTPPERPAAHQRRMALAAAHRFDASQPGQARLLLERVVESAEPGPLRAELLRRLARYRGHSGQSLPAWAADLQRALHEAADHHESRIAINLDRCVVALNSGDLRTARLIAEEALKDLERGSGNAALEAQCCAGLALLDVMLCQPSRPDLVRRALAGARHQPVRLSMELRPNVAIGHVLHWNGDLDGARRLYEEEYQRAREEGIETELPLLLWGLVETETWAGRWPRAEQLAEQGCRAAEEAESAAGVALMLGARSLLQVCRGQLDAGRRDAARSMRAAAELGMSVVPRMCAHALGVAGLSQGDAAGVHQLLSPFVQPGAWSGGLEPALWRFLPDEIEALVRLGQFDQAQAILEPYESWSAQLGRGFGVAAAARCRGLASVGTVVIGLTGTVIALVGLYLIALGAWGIHRGLLGALIAFTALLAVGALTLPWVRTELWGTNGNSKNGLVPRDVLPWLRGSWWAGLVLLGGILLLAILPSIWGRSRSPANPGTERPAAGEPAQSAPSATEPAAGIQPQPVTMR
jgi:hypothetical protein